MIDAATSVSPLPPKRTPAPVARGAAEDFRTTLETVADKPAAEANVVRRDKKDDAPPSPDADTAAQPADTVDPRTCGTSRPGKGQRIAGGGKTLPGKVRDEHEKELIWLPVGMVALPPPPATCPLALPLPRFGGAVVSSASDSALTLPAASPAEAGAQLGEVIEGAAPSPDGAPAFAGEGKGEAGPATSRQELPASVGDAKAEAHVRIDAPTQALPQATPQSITQPAGQAFAAAIAAAIQAQPTRDEREPMDAHAPPSIAGVALEALHTPAIAATADAKQGALDLSRDSGLQGMIDHIEVLRDNADAGDTRIRLVPDALGAVDVSVRKEGDRVHVHFNAEHAASARLLNEAQPRLAELADARGVKLGQTSVDSGAGDARQQRPAPTLAAAPAVAVHTESPDLITDTRIA